MSEAWVCGLLPSFDAEASQSPSVASYSSDDHLRPSLDVDQVICYSVFRSCNLQYQDSPRRSLRRTPEPTLRAQLAVMPHTMATMSRLPLLVPFFWATLGFGEMRIIDDTYGDSVTGALPTYSDTDCWSASPCSDCTLQPNSSQAYNGTWHDTSSNTCSFMDDTSAMVADHSVSFAFSGQSLTTANISKTLIDVDCHV